MTVTETKIDSHDLMLSKEELYALSCQMPASEAEMYKHFLIQLRHQFNVEDALIILGCGTSDLYQRPHDGVGEGNKFQIEVANGMALEYRAPKVDFKTFIEPAILYHRKNQYHHLMWNGPDPNDKTKPHPDALKHGEDGLRLGALDAVLALGEDRLFNGGPKTFEQIEEIAKAGPPHKRPYILEMLREIRKIPKLPLEDITDIFHVPNIGVPKATYDAIMYHLNQSIDTMRREHGYFR